MNSIISIEVFQAPCCNPSQSTKLTTQLSEVKSILGDKVEVQIHNISAGDEESWLALAILTRYIKEKGLNRYFTPGPSGIISALPSIAINKQLTFMREIPTRQQFLDAVQNASKSET